MSGSVVTSWEAQLRLPYHLVKRPYVEFRDDARYLVTVRFNRRLRRVPRAERGDPDSGGRQGPTRASMLIDEFGGDIWPGLATVSYEQPCYGRDFGQGDDHAPPGLFPAHDGKLVMVTLRVPGQPWISLRVRARRSSGAHDRSAAARHLGCKVWQVGDQVG